MSTFPCTSNLSRVLILLAVLSLWQCQTPEDAEPETETPTEDFTRITYQNPDLLVDLGVGLWAWPLPMDYDMDGDMDLIVSCPDTPFNGIYFFENKRKGEDGLPIFGKPVRLGDAKKNLQVVHINGEARVMGPGVEFVDFKKNIYEQPKELYPNKELEEKHQKIRFSQWKYVDYENDGDLDLIAGIDDWGDYGWDNAFDDNGNWTNGPLHGYVYLLENQDGQYSLKGKIEAGGAPIDVYGAPSPSMEDFDGDGDLDLICGEFLDRLTWFENIGTRTEPKYAEGKFLSNSSDELIKLDLEMITPTAVDWDQDGDIDLIVGDEDGRVALVENTGTRNAGMPVFRSPVYLKQEADFVKFGALVTPYSVDWDEDGDEDLICGNTAGYIGFIENLDGGNPPTWAAPKRLEIDGQPIRVMAGENGSIQGPAEKKWGYTTLSVADWDGDGLKDVITNSIWGKIEWYKNVGSKGNPQLSAAQPVKVAWNGTPPKPEWNWWDPAADELATQWRTTPNTIDWNKDGLVDLIMLDHEGYLAYFERFDNGGTLQLKPGQRIFHGTNGSEFDRKNEPVVKEAGPLRLNEGLYGKSGRRKWCFVDWDQDGDMDILVNSKNVALFENTGTEDGKVQFAFKGDLSDTKLAGHTTSPTIVDWDKNGVPDLLLGAEDGFLYHFKNQAAK